jgi:hypothetical protein
MLYNRTKQQLMNWRNRLITFDCRSKVDVYHLINERCTVLLDFENSSSIWPVKKIIFLATILFLVNFLSTSLAALFSKMKRKRKTEKRNVNFEQISLIFLLFASFWPFFVHHRVLLFILTNRYQWYAKSRSSNGC